MNKDIKRKVQNYIDNVILPDDIDGMDGTKTAGMISSGLIDWIEDTSNIDLWKPTDLTKAIMGHQEEFTKMVKDSFIALANDPII